MCHTNIRKHGEIGFITGAQCCYIAFLPIWIVGLLCGPSTKTIGASKRTKGSYDSGHLAFSWRFCRMTQLTTKPLISSWNVDINSSPWFPTAAPVVSCTILSWIGLEGRERGGKCWANCECQLISHPFVYSEIQTHY